MEKLTISYVLSWHMIWSALIWYAMPSQSMSQSILIAWHKPNSESNNTFQFFKQIIFMTNSHLQMINEKNRIKLEITLSLLRKKMSQLCFILMLSLLRYYRLIFDFGVWANLNIMLDYNYDMWNEITGGGFTRKMG